MVYGAGDRSPVVLYSPINNDDLGNELYMLPDKVSFFDNLIEIDSLIDNGVPPESPEGLTSEILVSAEGKYFNMLSELRYDLDYIYSQ